MVKMVSYFYGADKEQLSFIIYTYGSCGKKMSKGGLLL